MTAVEVAAYRKKWPSLRQYRGEHVVFKDHWHAADASLMRITNRYTREERMRCRVNGERTAPASARPGEKVRECTLYPIPQCLNVLRFFKPKKWLDPTMGWGDRLISGLLYGVGVYVGCDTNAALHPAYDKIVADLGKSTAVTHLNASFLTAPLGNQKFDLIYTSPPFGMYEVYEGAAEWKTAGDFTSKFLFPFLDRCVAKLSKGGHLVLYIADYDGQRFITDMLAYMKGKLTYDGIIYYEGSAPRPHYVWSNP